MMKAFLIFLVVIINCIQSSSFSVNFWGISAQNICYESYGCFSLEPPWKSLKRPFVRLPQDPFKINTRFLLYTRNEPQEIELLINKTLILQMSSFDKNKPTRFLIHGFLGSGYDEWIQDLKRTLLRQGDDNIIIVDWKVGAQLPFIQAAANIRLVGVEIAQMIEFLNKEGKQSYENIHIIGHDMGAHAAGYAGKKIKKIGRITGLDPTAPYFSGSDTILRLDREDANFVDVIHTDDSSLIFLGMGIKEAIGHVDFYPNGGKEQPGCGDLLDRIKGSIWDLLHLDIIGAQQTFACSHNRSVAIFTESIMTSCPYVAFPCENWKDFQNGKCKRCDQNQCTQFGFHSDQFKSKGKMYLSTNGHNPYCEYTHLVSLTTSSNQKSIHGMIFVKLIGKSGRSEFVKVNGESLLIEQGKTFHSAITSRLDIGDIKEVQVQFKDNAIIFHGSFRLDKIIVQSLDSKLRTTEFQFCANDKRVDYGKTETLESNTC